MDELKASGANKGAPGVDGQSIAEFEEDLKDNLYKIWNRMSSGSYFPPPVLAVEIPKAHGQGTRILGVPCVADRVAQTVVARELEKKVEPIFHPDSYGYRSQRSALDAVAACRQRCWETDWVIDLDIARFFDSVPWDRMVKAVEANTDLPWVVLYVKRWLAAPLALPDGTLLQRDRGTPQGSAVSPVIANLFLHYAFDAWLAREFPACTTRSMPGWPGSSRPSGSSATWMTRWSTASARPRRSVSWRLCGSGWTRSGCCCIRARPGSSVRHVRKRERPRCR